MPTPGEYTTTKFTDGGSGDYDVDWTYNAGNDGRKSTSTSLRTAEATRN